MSGPGSSASIGYVIGFSASAVVVTSGTPMVADGFVW